MTPESVHLTPIMEKLGSCVSHFDLLYRFKRAYRYKCEYGRAVIWDWPHENHVYTAPFKKTSALFQQKEIYCTVSKILRHCGRDPKGHMLSIVCFPTISPTLRVLYTLLVLSLS